ncbi:MULTISPECIES: alpha/beta hydrolase [Fischerella]|uniref:Alpha/beta hydrolase n=1 Tax=Fischerella muscicola CCMEE 5323 TaxID=2019572 RepID=A0A2N6K9F7_FISMU|nr:MULTISPECIES: alpha/beta hydrolase [Fischerella]MBD2434061.1 lysophospholipase [Fischerella sp. FACHB-380]PLZ94620.1 alpha/beta hydrolase [Fischerella muscicola CCMEE 5323]
MTHIEGTFAGAGGLNLYYQSWQPEGELRAIIAIVHGLGAHSGLFINAVQHLLPLGYAVYAFDLRGHGRSPGQRGHINSWAELREDLHTFLTHIQEQSFGCAYFLWGHSLGAVIAVDYALRFPQSLQGLILTAPALGKVNLPLLKVALGRMLSQVWPNFSLKVGFDKGKNLRGQNYLTIQDPLRHEYGSARLAAEFFATEKWVETHACELQVPLLILYSSEDKIAPPEGCVAFFQKIAFPDKESYEYPGDYHDFHLDLNYQKILVDLENWLERHLDGEIENQSSRCLIKIPTFKTKPLTR